MLEVHPPHEAAHSWRDFLIHIATIVVGLLIAVGLEQGVEAVHHHRERVELEEHLYRQAEQNSKALDTSRLSWQDRAAWITDCIELVGKAPAVGDSVTVALPTANKRESQPSQRSAWSLAKANGALALLPAGEQEMFERVDWIAEQEELGFQRFSQVLLEEQAIEKELGVMIEPGATIHFAASQREKLVSALAKEQVAVDEEAHSLLRSELFDLAIADKPGSMEELRRLLDKHFQELSKP